MGLNKIIESKLKKAFKELKVQKQLLKQTVKQYASMARASRWTVVLKELILKLPEEDLKLKNVKVEFIKSKNRVGLTVKTVKQYSIGYAINKNAKRPRMTFLRNLEFVELPLDFTVKTEYDEVEFSDCVARGIYYKGELMDIELPFSDDYVFIDKEGKLRRGITRHGRLIKEL